MKNHRKNLDPDWLPEVIEKWSQALADEIDQEILKELIDNNEKEIKHSRD